MYDEIRSLVKETASEISSAEHIHDIDDLGNELTAIQENLSKIEAILDRVESEKGISSYGFIIQFTNLVKQFTTNPDGTATTDVLKLERAKDVLVIGAYALESLIKLINQTEIAKKLDEK